jgi:hypothetical protein
MKPYKSKFTEAKDRRFTDTVAFSLDQLIDAGGIEGFNEMVENTVNVDGVLSDINYKVKGVKKNGDILISVNALLVNDN